MVAGTVTGCGSAAGGIPAGELGITARDGYLEANSIARSWDRGARLRYVEGEGVTTTGQVLPQAGQWLFHFSAPGQAQQLVVRVTPLETGSEERAPTSPPGYVVGDNVLGSSWIDSPEVMEAVLTGGEAAAGAATADLLLVPSRPEQWVVRLESGAERYRVHAETGDLLSQ